MTDHETRFTVEPGRQEVLLQHTFGAPRQLVFRVYTDPGLIPHWWGPSELTTTVEAMEVRHGGIWRISQVGRDGRRHLFFGVYHSAEAPARLVRTFEYGGTPGHVVLETVDFQESSGATRVTTHSVYQSVADRDAMAAAGMEQGAVASMERLATLIGGAGG